MHRLAALSPALTVFLITGITIFLLFVDVPAAFASQDTFPYCNRTFSCGPLTNVNYPFSGGLRPDYCGLPGFQLTCVDNTTTLITINSLVYGVIQLNQLTQTLLLSREDLFNTTCTNLLIDTAFNNTLFTFGANSEIITLFYGCNESALPETSKPQNMFSCQMNGSKDAYFLIGLVPRDPILNVFKCSASIQVPVLFDLVDDLEKNRSLLSYVLKMGFNANYRNTFSEDCVKCYHSGGECGFDISLGRSFCICDDDRPCPGPGGIPLPIKLSIGLSSAFAGLIIISGCYYCFRTKRGIWSDHKAMKQEENNIEAFITNYHSLMPQRYSYPDIKKMTNFFTHKLGQGGFGSVYRGNLSDGRPVAVKLLLMSIGDGEEFINEVASISRTSHVNIVTLLGFCYQKTKRALVYEYMPNGSLEKLICQLEQKQLFEITIGIARGLEYLHRGCNTRIVHFDIKPHNILLDNDMCPKISDFGLAKLCKGKESIVSMLGARGTAGYIAPEVFMRGYGGVSYKSDVYSYGMMILEMFAGKDMVDNEGTETSSSVYFPDSIYKYLERGEIDENMMLGEEEETVRRRMIIVGLWCIQTNPTNRPSMTKVIEMLEGSIEFLHVPPKPLLSSSTNHTEFSSSSTYLQSQLDEENVMPLPEAEFVSH